MTPCMACSNGRCGRFARLRNADKARRPIGGRMLRPLGARALIDPIETQRSTVIALTDRDIPVVGRIRELGVVTCPHCGAQTDPDVTVGAMVLVPLTSGEEITGDGKRCWIVPIEDLLAEVEKEPV